MEKSFSRIRVIEVSPRKNYLTEVVRELRNFQFARTNMDPLFNRVVAQMRFNLVWESGKNMCFKYSIEDLKHHRGEVYLVSFAHGLCRVSCTGGEDRPVVTIDAPAPESLEPESLEKALELLAVKDMLDV